jgi:hypothetical protein
MSSYQGIPLPDYQNWACADWIAFHKALLKKFERVDANLVWAAAFNNKPTSWNLNKICTSNENFIDYFKKQGITFDESLFAMYYQSKDRILAIRKYAPWVIGITGGLILIYALLVVYRAAPGLGKGVGESIIPGGALLKK